MQLYDDGKKRIGTLDRVANKAITKTLNSGDKEISFEYPVNGELVDLLKEEYYIRTKEDEYVLKEIELGEKYNKYTAVLNVEELEGTQFPYGFASLEQQIRACLDFAFEDTEWRVRYCTVTKRRTIDIEEKTTAWDVLQQCLKTYRCECRIDSINKRVDIYEQIGEDRGCYFMEGLNLRKLSVKSDTYEFYTRIYPIGKEGITIEWLHGKPYLENYQYSKKVKTYVWKDERYTNTTSLIEDAEAKLEEMSKPYVVYTADVADLVKANPVYKNVLDFGIGDAVTLVSWKTNTREKQRIVKIVEYPDSPEKNTVELSNLTKTFAEVQKTETELAKHEAISIAKSSTKKILGEYPTIETVETWITASEERVSAGVSQRLEGYYTKSETLAQIEVEVGKINMEVYQKKEDMGAYSTTTETRSLIAEEVGRIDMSVYQKKTDMSNYSTTTETETKISAAVGSLDLSVYQKTSGMSDYVQTKEIVASINMTPEEVKIKANKISLEGLVTANQNFKVLLDGSIEAENGKFKGTIESKNAKITGGSLKVGTGCELTTSGVLYAISPRMFGGLNLGKTIMSGDFENQDYGLAMYYLGDLFHVGSKDTGTTWMNDICPGKIVAYGDISCTGTKNRVVETEDFGPVKQYCYEMASPMFGDAGSGKLDGRGVCYIFLDTKFVQTVNTGHEYLVFLTAAGEGALYAKKEEIQEEYFVVRGTPGLDFFWEVKAKQKGYETDRLGQAEEPEGNTVTEEDQAMLNELSECVMNTRLELEKDELEAAETEEKRMEELEEWMKQG